MFPPGSSTRRPLLARRRTPYLNADVLAHHAGILMFEDMAMKHERMIACRQLREWNEDLRILCHHHRVFPAL